MKTLFLMSSLFLAACLGAAEIPSFEQIAARIRPGHPRMFLTEEQLPAFRTRANTICKDSLNELKKRVRQLPLHPKLNVRDSVAEIRGGELIFRKNVSDQNAAVHAIPVTGGAEALQCAIVYLATGDRAGLEKAKAYLRLLTEFVQWCDRYRIMPEWYHHNRLSGLVAFDWLYNELTPEERRAFLAPMLKHIEHMRKPGYMSGQGHAGSGNYGERGLQWFAGLAAYREGVDDACAEKLLRDGFNLNVEMMNLREEISGGSGVLASICSGYSFGFYPFAGYNFLHTLQSAAGIDGTVFWRHMADYVNWFTWAAIPSRKTKDGFLDYGWGDAGHMTNGLASWMMYTHLAQAIHFYGKAEPERARQARLMMSMIPPHIRKFMVVKTYPYLPFILFGFEAEEKKEKTLKPEPAKELAAWFPTFGLMIVRSGMGENDTFASVKVGTKYTQHMHYDENSFIIYKKGFQALDTGDRGSAKHHLIYYPQTIAHNAILIRMENEPLPGYWYPRNAEPITEKVFNDGGQNRLGAARPLSFDRSEFHAVAAGDATACYSPGKCREAIRQFVYIAPDYFVIYDRVASVRPDQKKSWLIHTQNEPKQLSPRLWRGEAGEGALFIRSILPETIQPELIGGKGKEFWTNGRNWECYLYSKRINKPNWFGAWRLELSPAKAESETSFLTVLQAADKQTAKMVDVRPLRDETRDGVSFTTMEGRECEVWFNRGGKTDGRIMIRQNGRLLLDRSLSHPVAPQEKAAVRKPAHPSSDVARVDVALAGGDVVCTDRGTSLLCERPRWLRGGCVVQFAADAETASGTVLLRAEKTGKLLILLRGPDVRKDGRRLPRYIEFTEFSVNGKALLSNPVRVWHDKPQKITLPVKAGEELKIRAVYRTSEKGTAK